MRDSNQLTFSFPLFFLLFSLSFFILKLASTNDKKKGMVLLFRERTGTYCMKATFGLSSLIKFWIFFGQIAVFLEHDLNLFFVLFPLEVFVNCFSHDWYHGYCVAYSFSRVRTLINLSRVYILHVLFFNCNGLVF